MHAHISRRASVELHDTEIETAREILRLAYLQLHSQPATPLHGSPLTRQAGLCGPELFRLKKMLDELGRTFGIELPYDPVVVPAPFLDPLSRYFIPTTNQEKP